MTLTTAISSVATPNARVYTADGHCLGNHYPEHWLAVGGFLDFFEVAELRIADAETVDIILSTALDEPECYLYQRANYYACPEWLRRYL